MKDPFAPLAPAVADRVREQAGAPHRHLPVPLLDAHWIGGRWRAPATAAVFDVVNPATEEVIGTVPAGTAADTDAAVAAFPPWAATPLPRRVELVTRIVDGLVARADELAAVITAEVGAPVGVARQAQVGLALGMAGSFLPLAATLRTAERVGNSLVTREPAGVVAAITPWNMPLLLTVQKIGPVLSVLPYADEDEAVRIANDTPYGLHGAVFAADDDRALALARRLRTGLVDVNGGPFNPLAPFGGFGQSGLGRECGIAGLESFCEVKSYQLPAAVTGLTGPQLRR